MEKDSILLSVLVNREFFARSLINTGCEIYSMVNAKFAAKCKLPRIQIEPRTINGVSGGTGWKIEEVAYAELDIGGHHQRRAFFYVVPKLPEYELILGQPWFIKERVEIDPCENCLRFKDSGLVVKQDCNLPEKNGALVSASAYQMLMEKVKKDKTYQV